MEVRLTPEQDEFVRQAIENGRFDRAEDAVQVALNLWEERERKRAEILTALNVADASLSAGAALKSPSNRCASWPVAFNSVDANAWPPNQKRRADATGLLLKSNRSLMRSGITSPRKAATSRSPIA